jgi:hypothetical protein
MATNYYKREPFGTPKTNHKMGFHYFLMTHDHKKKMEMMVSVLYMIHILNVYPTKIKKWAY